MYKIKHNQDLNLLEIENDTDNLYAKIYLNDGASLQELTLDKHAIIKNLHPLTYDNTYASSILFPFANRIKDGAYVYNGESYQLEANQKEENNALHGLIYNKSFKVVDTEINESFALVKLEYIETQYSKGFPYTYAIQLEYKFYKDELSLKVLIKNTDSKAFPYTLGWHPYFLSSDLNSSSLKFDSNKKLIIGERNITSGVEDIKSISVFDLKDKQLDDCWILNSNEIQFVTPEYNLKMTSSSENNFLQVYTPPKENTIAIEPTTGVSDSFNNKIGLAVLNAGDSCSITWKLKVEY